MNGTQNWKSRVREEAKELDAKIGKLQDFIDSKLYQELEAEDRRLLQQQWGQMISYSNTLWERIARF